MKVLGLKQGTAVPEGRITLPASKSISNRYSILARASGGKLRIKGLSEAGDSSVLQKGIAALDQGKACIDLADAGTAMRFLTALASTIPGTRSLTGTQRMKERPIGPLVEALRELGADIRYEEKEGYPPIRIKGTPLKGGRIRVPSDKSSQFFSALALIAPFTEESLEMKWEDVFVSRSYFELTLAVLRDIGVSMHEMEDGVRILPTRLSERTLWVEGDHSAAAFWYELLAIKGKGGVHLGGLDRESPQADRWTPRFFECLGIQTYWDNNGCWIEAVPGANAPDPYEADMQDHPDLVPALAVTLAAMGKRALLTGVGTLRYKESDRIEALRTELARIGVDVRADGENLGIDPSGMDLSSCPRFDTHEDHRIAMALAPLVVILPELEVRDPDVVKKSYPTYWEDLQWILPGVLSAS
ncbi:MAG: 3-phosphoshikimate 1-carboxyvinyltransferase [Flavobacteriales bacterium]